MEYSIPVHTPNSNHVFDGDTYVYETSLTKYWKSKFGIFMISVYYWEEKLYFKYVPIR